MGFALVLRAGALGMDPDELGVTLAEEVAMSGPELLAASEVAGDVVPDGRVDVYVVLLGDIPPHDRRNRFEDPLLAALGAGTEFLSGGRLWEKEEDGSTKTAADFSVQAEDRENIVELVRAALQRAKAPLGSTFTLTRGEEQSEDHEVYAP